VPAAPPADQRGSGSPVGGKNSGTKHGSARAGG
jgi:hypothetical protein